MLCSPTHPPLRCLVPMWCSTSIECCALPNVSDSLPLQTHERRCHTHFGGFVLDLPCKRFVLCTQASASFISRFSPFLRLIGILVGPGLSAARPITSHYHAQCNDYRCRRFGFVPPTTEVVALTAFALALSATRYLKKSGDFRKHGHVELLF